MEKLSDDWKDMSISVGTMDIEKIVHAIESTFPDVEVAKGVYQICNDFWNANKENRPSVFIIDIWAFLNEIAPKGYYFGFYADNDPDLGFWEGEDPIKLDLKNKRKQSENFRLQQEILTIAGDAHIMPDSIRRLLTGKDKE